MFGTGVFASRGLCYSGASLGRIGPSEESKAYQIRAAFMAVVCAEGGRGGGHGKADTRWGGIACNFGTWSFGSPRRRWTGIDCESTHAWINSGKQRCTTRDAAGAEMRQAGEWTTSDKVARLKAARIKARRQIAQ